MAQNAKLTRDLDKAKADLKAADEAINAKGRREMTTDTFSIVATDNTTLARDHHHVEALPIFPASV